MRVLYAILNGDLIAKIVVAFAGPQFLPNANLHYSNYKPH